MTGYGRGISGNFRAEARSFNHKNLDILVKLPSFLYPYENDIRKLVRSRFTRGHIEVGISRPDTETVRIKVNRPLAKEYHQALSSLKSDLELAGEIDINVLASFRDILCPEEEAEFSELNNAVEIALQELEKMRTEEGSTLVGDISGRTGLLTAAIDRIEARRNEVIADIKQKLHERLKEFLGDIVMDESRLVQEAAVLIEKSDITEEIVRVRSHMSHFSDVLMSGDTIGKKLDFIVQELRREVNTIGSKTSDVMISNHVIEMKHEIEKIKEQIQNLQ